MTELERLTELIRSAMYWGLDGTIGNRRAADRGRRHHRPAVQGGRYGVSSW